MTTYRTTHRTTYRYGSPMTDGYTIACVRPRPTLWQHVVEASIRVEPASAEQDSYLDAFGNLVHQFGVHEPHDTLTVESVSVVDVSHRPNPVDHTAWEDVVGTISNLSGDLAVDVGWYRAASTHVAADDLDAPLAELTAGVFAPGRPLVEAASALCRTIYEQFEFDPSFSTVSTPLADVLTARRGVCQDFAHLAIACLRSVGLSARYVSGYIETVPPPGMPKLVGADASHAWCSVWSPQAGWVDFDPTNNHLPVNDHVTIGWGRDYSDVTPVRGVVIGPSTSQVLDVSVDVSRE